MDTLDERTRAAAEALMKNNTKIKETDIEFMIEAFKVMDTDGSKFLEFNEVKQLLNVMGKNPTDDDVKKHISTIDTTMDGKVDLAEFFQIIKFVKTNKAEKDDLRSAFKVFDRDGNGRICKSELKAVLKNMEAYQDDEEIDMMMASADTDKDGTLDIDELVEVFNQPVEELKDGETIK